jgi:hypothetical protein
MERVIEPTPKEKRGFVYFLFEKFPPAIFIFVIAFLIFGGLLFPEVTAYLIIVINVYFLYKSATLAIFLVYVFNKIWVKESIDWQEKLQSLDSPEQSIERLEQEIKVLQSKNDSELTTGWRRINRNLSQTPKFARIYCKKRKSEVDQLFKKANKRIKKSNCLYRLERGTTNYYCAAC